ncbi:MAG: hypothetical protein JWN03_5984 [Nocardia sp.]|uniref:hypothetical protein n=1 Tax=Nocardia sp. TaxID=1821 RepID=UPI00260CDDA8|nr:hypothetical protein [Nocardia sp.]MCU1645709.1 hypothetical protein [Nocardia sp.]
MAQLHPHRRSGRTATLALAAISIAGTLGVSVLAYSSTHSSAAPATSDTGSTAPSDSSNAPDSGTAPQVSSGSGSSHARSHGS